MAHNNFWWLFSSLGICYEATWDWKRQMHWTKLYNCLLSHQSKGDPAIVTLTNVSTLKTIWLLNCHTIASAICNSTIVMLSSFKLTENILICVYCHIKARVILPLLRWTYVSAMKTPGLFNFHTKTSALFNFKCIGKKCDFCLLSHCSICPGRSYHTDAGQF